ncbi:MAG: hypothetical protein U9N73_10660, partial [Candidatus Auribacterota bacterium]|nr:hypothetical protein [Candidatus Auribacterota bacterium]
MIGGETPAQAGGYPLPEYHSISKGLKYGRVEIKDIPLIYHVLLVDLTEPGVEVRPIRARGRDETIEKMSSRILALGEPLLAAVNGDYFKPATKTDFLPWGILVEDAALIFSPTDKSGFILGKDGKPLITVPDFKADVSFAGSKKKYRVLSVNRPLKIDRGECCLFTRGWDTSIPEYEDGFAVTISAGAKVANGLIHGKVVGVLRMPVGVTIPEDGYVLIFSDFFGSPLLKPDLGEPA